MMKLTVKVFVDNSAALANYDIDIIETYDSFIVAHMNKRTMEEIAMAYPLENISSHFNLVVNGREFDTDRPRLSDQGVSQSHPAYRGIKAPDSGEHHYLVQFIGPIKKKWLSALKRKGADPREPYQQYTYVVRGKEKVMSDLVSLPYVRWVGHLCHKDRLHLEDEEKKLPRTHLFPDLYVVQFFDKSDLKTGLAKVKRCGASVVTQHDKTAQLTIELSGSGRDIKNTLADISAVHGVRSIRRKVIKRTSNNVAAGLINARHAYVAPTDLSGAGEIVAVCDTGLDSGDADNIHPDFENRVVGIESFPITDTFSPFIHNPGANDGGADEDSGHGTHVAGSVLGSGAASDALNNSTPSIKGIAPQAQLYFQAIEQRLDWKNPQHTEDYGRYLLAGIPDDLSILFNSAYLNGARIHSNSWGGGDPGAYDSQCQQLDEFVWNHKDFCVLVAAGNDGSDKEGDGRINPLSVSSPATAKNCISVGASETLRPQFESETYGSWWPNDYPVPPIHQDSMAAEPEQVVAFSSRGPTQDGRLKPEIVAPGTFILSTRSTRIAPNNMAWGAYPPSRHYFHMGGTSMATPIASGAVALLRQFLRQWVAIENPSAALLKACLVAGAVRLPDRSDRDTLFDMNQGYGLINIDGIVATAAGVDVYFVDEPDGLDTGESTERDITIRSSDIPLRVVLAYSDYPGESLVNNLNLLIEAPDGRLYVGNAGPTQGLTADANNNTEAINIEFPMQGSWTVKVIGSNVPHGPQDYALCLRGSMEM